MVIINPLEKKYTTIIDSQDELKNYYEKHKEEIWVGYNSRNYDQYILKAILCGFNPKKINDHIISGNGGWTFSSLLQKVPLNNYDVMTSFHGLKQLEGFMGNNIKETSVDFNLDRKLTQAEIDETVKYCTHDVEQTIEVFFQRKNDFDAHLALIKTFNLPLIYIGKTQAQLASIILEAQKISHDDDWEIRLPDTYILNKYQFVAEWFLNPNNYDENAFLDCEIAGIPHTIGWGGLHGAIDKYFYKCKEDELLVMADVDQLYPTLMIRYHLLSRGIRNYDKFKNILETSLRLKREKKKKEREPYKKICNITYGAMGDKYNNMYDNLHRKLVCVFGQVLLVDLLEKLESFCELIQSNTDGILVKIKRKDFEKLDDTIYEWENRTGLHMSFDIYETVIQKDVNNYIIIDSKGNFKSKGGYVKQLGPLDYDLPIINEALVNYMTKGIKIEETINNCKDLIKFQKIVKVSSKYLYGWHNGKKQTDKTYRVFASKDLKDGYIGKQKCDGATIEKFANTPEHCFIDNEDMKDKTIPSKLDRKWYIDFAYKRLEDFGIEVN